MTKYIFGIDISKDKLDIVTIPDNAYFTLPNNQQGIDELLEKLNNLELEVVALEASGGYEHSVVHALANKGHNVAVINPRLIRHYAKAKGILAKTDAIDAKVIAQYALDIKPDVRELPDEQLQKLNALVARRNQLIQMRTAEKNREKQAHQSVVAELKKHILWLDKKIKRLDKDISNFIKNTPLWKEKDELLQSTPSVGPVLSRVLISELPELGTVSHKKIAALVGVAPFNCDSGRFKGKRRTYGGRPQIRKVLYMATLNAIRFNPAIKNCYDRLCAAGKIPMIAITACMRKLITMLNAMIRDHKSWSFSTS